MRLLKLRTLFKFADDSGHQLVDFWIFKSLKWCVPLCSLCIQTLFHQQKLFFMLKLLALIESLVVQEVMPRIHSTQMHVAATPAHFPEKRNRTFASKCSLTVETFHFDLRNFFERLKIFEKKFF